VSPYHPRLDWSMWFLPLRVMVTPSRIFTRGHPRWFLRFVQQLLRGDSATLSLLRHNPFPGAPPRFIRASFYAYELTPPRERLRTGLHWQRRYVGEYLAAQTLSGTIAAAPRSQLGQAGAS
jgi:hypothetical protein